MDGEETILFLSIQHDKARDMRNAVIHQRLETSLCNFHGLAAYREHIQQDPALKPFLEALLTRFKAVMRAWCPRVQDSLIMSYKLFISNIPPQTIPDGAKFKLFGQTVVLLPMERGYV